MNSKKAKKDIIMTVGNRRSLIERRRISYTYHIPENRSNKNRRNVCERRSNVERRSRIDRRKKWQNRQYQNRTKDQKFFPMGILPFRDGE